MITSFVFVMMLVIEYLNVLTQGNWERKLSGHRWIQYVCASFLGVIPGCLGAFTAVSLYGHRVITFGALVATMVASTGDAAFMMLAVFPDKAVWLIIRLFALGMISGAVLDLVFRNRRTAKAQCLEAGYVVHEGEACNCFVWRQIRDQWRHCSLHRGALTFFLGLFLLGVLTGDIGHFEREWVRVTLLVTACVGLFIVSTVPDHFLDEHLWNHVARKHVVRIFLWTLGALVLLHVLTERLHLDEWIKTNQAGHMLVLIMACVIGIIPDSSPHYVFIFLYAEGTIPLSILMANSIIHEGHGMLPMLAHSRRAFISVKVVKVVLGFAVGCVGYLAGW